MADALKFVNSNELVRDVALCGEASSNDEVLCLGSASISSLNVPAAFAGLELCIYDDAVEGSVAFDI